MEARVIAEQNTRGRMLISKDKQRYKQVDAKKTASGSFYTRGSSWLTSPVRGFISTAIAAGVDTAIDPFAGEGHMLAEVARLFDLQSDGYDINGYKGKYNDSLRSIPRLENSIIITNPPYLTNYSAKRKGIYDTVSEYFQTYTDLYQLALANCRKSCRYTLAVVPETILHSRYAKNGIVLVNVILANPFSDTKVPICVVCIDNQKKDCDFDIYIDENFVCDYSKLKQYKTPVKRNEISITFNDPQGAIGLKAVDGTQRGDKIRFLTDFEYRRENIKESSRLMTYVGIDGLEHISKDEFVQCANTLLARIREDTSDLVLSPFKGNNKDGSRRRRLDYGLARTIIISVLNHMGVANGQLSLI